MSAAGLPGLRARLELARGVVPLTPQEAVFEGMLAGWAVFGPGSLAALWVTGRASRISLCAIDDAFSGCPGSCPVPCGRRFAVIRALPAGPVFGGVRAVSAGGGVGQAGPHGAALFRGGAAPDAFLAGFEAEKTGRRR